MNATDRPSHLTQVVDKLKNKLFSSFIPLHARRAYFMASLARRMCDNNIPDEVLARNVSAAMNHLVSPRGLIYFFNKQNVWEGLPKKLEKKGDHFSQEEIAAFNKQAVLITPEWLRYSNERSMRQDAQLAITAAIASQNSSTFQRKLAQVYGSAIEKPKRRSLLATIFFGKQK